MIVEDKQLLFKDICSRLPYGVKCRQHKLDSQICTMYPEYLKNIEDVEKYEPYLRPISSMTEDEKKEYCDLQDKFIYNNQYPVTDAYELSDWLNAHNIDYRGLIEKGLALKAQTNMYNN